MGSSQGAWFHMPRCNRKVACGGLKRGAVQVEEGRRRRRPEENRQVWTQVWTRVIRVKGEGVGASRQRAGVGGVSARVKGPKRGPTGGGVIRGGGK